MTHMRHAHFVLFCSMAGAAWFLIIYLWPRIFLNLYKRAVLTKGFEGPIRLNTLATAPAAIFADPLNPPVSASRLATAGVNHDTIATAGVLDLRYGPRVLQVRVTCEAPDELAPAIHAALGGGFRPGLRGLARAARCSRSCKPYR